MKTVAFTMSRDEARFLPSWVKYYSQHFDHLLVLDHGSVDGSIESARKQGDFETRRLDYPIFNDFPWYTQTIMNTQRELLGSYDVVLFTEPDEMVWHPKGLRAYSLDMPAMRMTTTGYEICHMPGEPPIDWDQPVLSQRRSWRRITNYDKTLLASGDCSWTYGFHNCSESNAQDTDLILTHLHYIDRQYAIDRGQHKKTWQWSQEALDKELGAHVMDEAVMNSVMDCMVEEAMEIRPDLVATNCF